MNLIDSLKWRYATKAFDKDKKVSESDLEEVIEAFRLTPSSFGVQPWKLIVVNDIAKRQELLPNSWNQAQVVDASHLLVLARINNPGDSLVDAYMDETSHTTGTPKENLKGYEDMIKGFLNNLSVEQKNVWADRQVMISSGILMSLLAEKKIDSCPMEGFDRAKYNEILGLDKLGLSSVLVLPIGYRSTDDKYAQKPKVRFKKEDIIITI